MLKIIDWLNENQGFVMVILTFAYVLSTFIILLLNRRSVNAILEQNKISKFQFEERLRVENLPILDISFDGDQNKRFDSASNYFIDCNNEEKNCIRWQLNLKITNVGIGTATKIMFHFAINGKEENCYESHRKRTIPPSADIENSFIFVAKSIFPDIITIEECDSEKYRTSNNLEVYVYYQDVLGNCYVKKLHLALFSHAFHYPGVDEVHIRNEILISSEEEAVRTKYPVEIR